MVQNILYAIRALSHKRYFLRRTILSVYGVEKYASNDVIKNSRLPKAQSCVYVKRYSRYVTYLWEHFIRSSFIGWSDISIYDTWMKKMVLNYRKNSITYAANLRKRKKPTKKNIYIISYIYNFFYSSFTFECWWLYKVYIELHI